MADPNKPVYSAMLSYELEDLGTSTKATARAEISLPQMNIFLKAIIWFISRFGSPQGETALTKLRRIVEAEGSSKQAEPIRNIVRDNNGGFKFVDFPFWIRRVCISAVAFPALQVSRVFEPERGTAKRLFLSGGRAHSRPRRRTSSRSGPCLCSMSCGDKLYGAKPACSVVQAGPSPSRRLKVLRSSNRPRASLTYRVSLSTEEGVIPLTDAYSAGAVSKERCQRISDMINHLDTGPASSSDRGNR